MEAIISYIKRFLIGNVNVDGLEDLIGYTSDCRQFDHYKIVIYPSSFFLNNIYGTDLSMPILPLNKLSDIPLLFGTSEIEWHKKTLIIHADIIASTYFLITRYEEIRRRNIRDEHGRFPGKESLPYRAGFIHRPIVDEYGKLLRKWLREVQVNIVEPEQKINKIWLTHDVDAPFYCRTWRSFVRETLKGDGFSKAWQLYNSPLTADPYYTFPWLIKQGNMLRDSIGKDRCESLCFIKPSGKSKQDKPCYDIKSKDMKALFLLCETQQVTIGLHSSYDAGLSPALIKTELKTLERIMNRPIHYNRHHFLSLREPEDLDWLEKIGITDDFTMGYADMAGFRLGTSQPVRWINPINKHLSSLVLHPLTVMDCSLSEKQYMNLTYEEALAYCQQLIREVAQANGELILLWHNDTIATPTKKTPSIDWQKKLFKTLIEELKKL